MTKQTFSVASSTLALNADDVVRVVSASLAPFVERLDALETAEKKRTEAEAQREKQRAAEHDQQREQLNLAGMAANARTMTDGELSDELPDFD